MKMFLLVLLNSLLVSSLFAQVKKGRRPTSADLNIIRENIYNEIIQSVPESETKNWKLTELRQWMKTQSADGSFPDVDYVETKKTLWGAAIQVQRARFLYLASKTQGHPLYRSEAAVTSANLALKFFSSRKWHHINWWHREIGLPRNIYQLLILADDQIPKVDYDVLMDYARKGHLVDHPSKYPATGQNNIWYSETTVALAVLFDRPDWVDVSIKSVETEFTTDKKAGIQIDQTFYQHGPIFHNGGYGLDFANDVARFFGQLSGSSYSFSPGAYTLLSKYILDGQLWLIHKKVMDYSSKARHYPRENGGSSLYLLPACKVFSEVKGPRQQEFKDCARKIRSQSYTKTGNKLFFRGDFMTHHRPDFNISVKMHSTRTLNNDTSPLGEGLKSHHLSDGVTYIYRSGEEYVDIFPIWDFKLVPGTTEQYIFPYPPVPRDDYWPTAGNKTFVGGASDGLYGVATMDYSRDSLSAKKSWFFGDEAMVALGAGLTCPQCADVRTSINQEWSKTPIQYGKLQSNAEETLESGQKSFPTKSWFIANDTAYVVHYGGTVQFSNAIQKGSARSIDASKSTQIVSGKVTSLRLGHTPNPKNSSYAYQVYPNVSELNELNQKMKNVIIITNLPNVQAVHFRSEKMIQVIFHTPGILKIDETSSVIVNQPIALVLRMKANGKLSVAASDPSQRLSTLNVKINWAGKSIDTSLLLQTGALRGDSKISEF